MWGSRERIGEEGEMQRGAAPACPAQNVQKLSVPQKKQIGERAEPLRHGVQKGKGKGMFLAVRAPPVPLHCHHASQMSMVWVCVAKGRQGIRSRRKPPALLPPWPGSKMAQPPSKVSRHFTERVESQMPQGRECLGRPRHHAAKKAEHEPPNPPAWIKAAAGVWEGKETPLSCLPRKKGKVSFSSVPGCCQHACAKAA